MTINALSSVGSANSSLSGSRTSIADNFDTFLSLLTTQLKNQNPLDPLDTNQFTEQLVQFTSVEQQLKTNEFLEALITTTANSTATQIVNYIGKTVSSSTTVSELKGGTANWGFDAEQAAQHATFTIKDASGNVVYTETRPLEAGEGSFDWDGVTSTGATAPEGAYQITIDARDENGSVVPVSTEITGLVDGVDLSGDEPFLIIGKARISLSSVTSVSTS
jgi:flagellar basal-body rod modification protein FlgD